MLTHDEGHEALKDIFIKAYKDGDLDQQAVLAMMAASTAASHTFLVIQTMDKLQEMASEVTSIMLSLGGNNSAENALTTMLTMIDQIGVLVNILNHHEKLSISYTKRIKEVVDDASATLEVPQEHCFKQAPYLRDAVAAITEEAEFGV